MWARILPQRVCKRDHTPSHLVQQLSSFAINNARRKRKVSAVVAVPHLFLGTSPAPQPQPWQTLAYAGKRRSGSRRTTHDKKRN